MFEESDYSPFSKPAIAVLMRRIDTLKCHVRSDGRMLVVLRGNACSGKSTIAEELRSRLTNAKAAVIHTELFYWGIVHGDSPEVAMENTRSLVDTYLRNGYHVVVEGTLSRRDERGDLYVNGLMRLAEKHETRALMFFLEASYAELERREKSRGKIPLDELRAFYDETNRTKSDRDIVIDTTNKTVEQVTAEITSRF
jgi:predicted kinase